MLTTDDGQKVIRIAHLEPLGLGDLKSSIFNYMKEEIFQEMPKKDSIISVKYFQNLSDVKKSNLICSRKRVNSFLEVQVKHLIRKI